MAKKEKNGVVKKNIDKISNVVSKEIQKATDQIQGFLGDFSRQAEDLQKQLREPFKKFMSDMEEFRDKELKKIQDEYQRVITDISALQDQLSDKLGIPLPKLKQKEAAPSAKATTKAAGTGSRPASATAKSTKPAAQSPASAQAAKAKPAAKPKTAAKPAAKATTTAATKPAAKPETTAKAAGKTATKPAPKAKAAAPATKAGNNTTNKGDDLTKLTGVGPALAKKLKDAGIHSYKQIAEPNEADKKALNQIGKVKDSDKWVDEAKGFMSK